jgi:hypothetical protein
MYVPAFPIQDCMQTKKNCIFGRIPHPFFPLLLAQEFVTKETRGQDQTAIEEEESLLTFVEKTYAANDYSTLNRTLLRRQCPVQRTPNRTAKTHSKSVLKNISKEGNSSTRQKITATKARNANPVKHLRHGVTMAANHHMSANCLQGCNCSSWKCSGYGSIRQPSATAP